MTKPEVDALMKRYRADTLEGLVEALARAVKRLEAEMREMERDTRDIAAEERWRATQGEEYGSY